MLRIHHAEDAAAAADAIAEAVRRDSPELPLVVDAGGGAVARRTRGPAAWDELLIVLFGSGDLPPALRDLVREELTRAGAESRQPRLLPVSTCAARPVPPPPLQGMKALPCIGPAADEVQRIVRRALALLGLRTRDQGRQVFVSYRATDGVLVAEQLATFLDQAGYQAQLDSDWLQGGEDVQQAIQRHLSAASLVLLLDTPRASESDWIRQEIDGAIEHFVPILPVVLRPAGDPGKGPRFRALKELDRYAELTVELDAGGVCQPLTEAQLATLREEMEGYLSDVLRTLMMLPALAADSFQRAGFDWVPRPELAGLFETTRPEEGGAATRALTYCSPLPPTFSRAVEALKQFPRKTSGVSLGPLRYNYRIFLNQTALPTPELQSLATGLGLAQDAQLRILDPLGLELFLRRFARD